MPCATGAWAQRLGSAGMPSRGQPAPIPRQRARPQLRTNGAAPTLAPRSTNGNAPTGWGLVLVERIADQWGVLDGGPGTRVWFEVAA